MMMMMRVIMASMMIVRMMLTVRTLGRDPRA